MNDRDPLDFPATRHRLWRLFDAGVLPPSAWRDAHHIAAHLPSAADWRAFMDRLLLIVGAVFLVAGIVFFFAFNWADLHKFARFALLESVVVLTAALALWLRLDSWGGRVALAASAVLLGVTLGVVGQAYQTGADSYRLFMIWTLLITGWVLVSGWNVMYLIWMVLLNTTISLFAWQVFGIDESTHNLILIGVNLAFILLWDGLALFWRLALLRDRWHLYVLVLPVLGYATFHMLDFIFDFGAPPFFAVQQPVLVYWGVIVVIAFFYTMLQRDISMVTLATMSVLVVLIAWVGRLLWDLMELTMDVYVDPVGYTFVMGMISVGLTAALGFMLRRLYEYWEANPS